MSCPTAGQPLLACTRIRLTSRVAVSLKDQVAAIRMADDSG